MADNDGSTANDELESLPADAISDGEQVIEEAILTLVEAPGAVTSITAEAFDALNERVKSVESFIESLPKNIETTIEQDTVDIGDLGDEGVPAISHVDAVPNVGKVNDSILARIHRVIG